MLVTVLLSGMGLLALLTVAYALSTIGVRRAHDLHIEKARGISIPFILRFALGAYIVGLVYLAVRSWARRQDSASAVTTGEPEKPTSWRFTVAALAVVGVVLVVMVLQTTRNPPSSPEEHYRGNITHAVAPTELEVLGYLPDNAELVTAVHLDELFQEIKGKPYREALLMAGSVLGLDNLEQWTGLKLDDFTQVAVGVSAEPRPQVTLVAQTRKPYDPAGVRKALHGGPGDTYRERPLYSFAWDERHKALLWCAGPRTLVAVYQPGSPQSEELRRALPAKPRTGADKMPASLRPLFRQRPLAAGTPVWAAGHRNSALLWSWLGFVPLVHRERVLLFRLEDVRLSLRFTDQITLMGEIQMADVRTAKRLEDDLRSRQTRGEGKVERAPEDKWVTFQARVDRQAILQAAARSQAPKTNH